MDAICALRDLVWCLQEVHQNNFQAALLMLGGQMLSMHYEKKSGGVPATIAYGKVSPPKATKSSISSNQASKRILRRRSQELDQHRSVASAGSEIAQMRHEVQSLTPAERKYLLKDMEFKIEIPALTGLAMKANLYAYPFMSGPAWQTS